MAPTIRLKLPLGNASQDNSDFPPFRNRPIGRVKDTQVGKPHTQMGIKRLVQEREWSSVWSNGDERTERSGFQPSALRKASLSDVENQDLKPTFLPRCDNCSFPNLIEARNRAGPVIGVQLPDQSVPERFTMKYSAQAGTAPSVYELCRVQGFLCPLDLARRP